MQSALVAPCPNTGTSPFSLARVIATPGTVTLTKYVLKNGHHDLFPITQQTIKANADGKHRNQKDIDLGLLNRRSVLTIGTHNRNSHKPVRFTSFEHVWVWLQYASVKSMGIVGWSRSREV